MALYAKSQLEKSIKDINMFLALKENIDLENNITDVWERVNTD